MVTAFFLFVVVAGCKTAFEPELAGKLGKKELRVGVEPNFPPLIFKKDGKIVGIEADLAKELSDILGVRIVFVETEWSKLIPTLNNGQIDIIMSGMTNTKERAEQVKFIEPYIRVGQMALIRTSDVSKFPNAEIIKKCRVIFAALKGTTGEIFVKNECPNAFYIPYESIQFALNALKNKRVDILIADAPVIWDVSNAELTPVCEPLTEEYLAWAVSKNNPELADVLNQALKILKDNGTVHKIERKWIPEMIMENIYEK